MLGFKKKDKTKKQITQIESDPFSGGEVNVKASGDFPYYVELYDMFGSNSQRLPKFGVRRYIEGGNVFLYNEKNGFKEPMPSDSEDYKQFKIDEINIRLKEVTTKINNIEKDKKIDKNKKISILKDYRAEEKTFKRYKRSLELQGLGSYVVFDEASNGGKPIYQFDRVGNMKLPVFKNIDKSMMYTPNEANISEASDLIKENKEKNGKNNNPLLLVNLALAVILLLTISFFGYITYKVNDTPVDLIKGLDRVGLKLLDTSEKLEYCADLLQVNETETNPDLNPEPNLNILDK